MQSAMHIAAVGDLSFNGAYHRAWEDGRAPHILDAMAPHLRSDLTIGNLESPLTADPQSSAPKSRFCLRGDPRYAPVLKAAGIHAVSLANNHMMDYGWGAVEETVAALRAQGIAFFGAGKNVVEARRPARLQVSGRRVAVLGYCSVHVAKLPLYADDRSPGVALANPDHIKEDIARCRPESDLVIVCMHWGQEYVSRPTPKQRELAGQIAEAGADILLGHHPHVLQGAEHIGKTFVAYSLGNFVFGDDEFRGVNQRGEAFSMPYRISETSRRTGVLKLKLDPGQAPVAEFAAAYLSPELAVRPDESATRRSEWDVLARKLSGPLYRVRWMGSMLAARMRARTAPGSGPSFLRRLHRIRPKHLRDLAALLKQEWQQLRGVE